MSKRPPPPKAQRFELRYDGETTSYFDTRPGSGTEAAPRTQTPKLLSPTEIINRLNAGEGFRLDFHEHNK